jgi:hypothetical protein
MELVNELFTPDFLVMFLVAFLGMLTHFFKKQIKGETPKEIYGYFHDHVKSTASAIITVFIATAAYYLTLSTGQTADLVNTFTLGYMFDSMINQWSTKLPTIKE